MIINKKIYGERIDEVSPSWKFIGADKTGIVYSISEDKVIKIFREDINCNHEGERLLRVHGNRYFPNLIEIGENYIVREKVELDSLKDTIKRKGVSYEIAKKLVELLNEFEKIGFSRIDLRLKDIYVDKEENLKVIDPYAYLTREIDYPNHLCKELKKYGGLKIFLRVLYENNPELYNECMINIYRVNREETEAKYWKKFKFKSGKTGSYGIGEMDDFITGPELPIIEELDEDISFIDITQIDDLL